MNLGIDLMRFAIFDLSKLCMIPLKTLPVMKTLLKPWNLAIKNVISVLTSHVPLCLNFNIIVLYLVHLNRLHTQKSTNIPSM